MSETTQTTTQATTPILSLNHAYTFSINTTPTSTETFAEISKGFSNISQAINEVTSQMSFFGDGGWGSTEVTGGQLTMTLSGIRYYGDTAQDYIFSDAVKNNFGNARKTTFKIVAPNGDTISGNITLAKISESGGEANKESSISVEVHFNGKPTFTEASDT